MTTQQNGPVTPSGVNHLVLNVRDLDESHHFWSDLLGFKQVGEMRADSPGMPPGSRMRFYAGSDHHHDIALVQLPNLPEPPEKWNMFDGSSAVNHIAITYPTQEEWKRQVDFLADSGVKINLRVDHGMTHSIYINDPNGYGVEVLYDLPRDVWEHDVNGALNYAKLLPKQREVLTDESEYVSEFS
jgi:catechol 2,3-dioxygenase